MLKVLAALLDDAIRMRSADPFCPNSRQTTWRLPLVGLTTIIGDWFNGTLAVTLLPFDQLAPQSFELLHPDVAVRIVAAAEERRVGDVDHAALNRLRRRYAVRAGGNGAGGETARNVGDDPRLVEKAPARSRVDDRRAQIARRLVGIRRIVVVDEHRGELHPRLPFPAGCLGL